MSSDKQHNLRMIMAFDFGTKRIGVAVGQMITMSARPLAAIPAKEGRPELAALQRLLREWRPDALVVGIPLNMDGTDQPITHHARFFAQWLREQWQLPVYEADERLTTKDARERIFRQGGFKALQQGQVDSVAAQLILQNWFALINNGN